MFAFNVRLNGKTINTVFYGKLPQKTIVESCADVRNSLINHDCYDCGISVTWPKGQRVTDTEYELLGDYGYGFEVLTTETTRKAIRERLKEYRENSPGAYKVVKRHVKK